MSISEAGVSGFVDAPALDGAIITKMEKARSMMSLSRAIIP